MNDLVYTLMLIGGVAGLTLALRIAEHWCETHPRSSEAATTRHTGSQL